MNTACSEVEKLGEEWEGNDAIFLVIKCLLIEGDCLKATKMAN